MFINKNILAFLFAACFAFNAAYAQTPVQLHINHQLSGGNFSFGQAAQNDLGNSFNVTRLEYYISRISIKHDGGMTTPVPNHYILANGGQAVVDDLGSFNITNVESISFHIGVDTPVNHADPSLQPSGHPLAPKSPSMHWGWSAGYRFVAMEGKSGTSLNQTYEIHALGDQHYFETTVPATGVMKNGKLVIAIKADYAMAIKGINISSGLIAHGDGGDEAKLLANFRDHVFSASSPVSVANHIERQPVFAIYPNPSTSGQATMRFEQGAERADIIVTDISGKTILVAGKAEGATTVELAPGKPGLYFVHTKFADGYSTVDKLLMY
ncbi:MAG TPA: MbnP family protein [Flavipsychrobacter sp.]